MYKRQVNASFTFRSAPRTTYFTVNATTGQRIASGGGHGTCTASFVSRAGFKLRRLYIYWSGEQSHLAVCDWNLYLPQWILSASSAQCAIRGNVSTITFIFTDNTLNIQTILSDYKDIIINRISTEASLLNNYVCVYIYRERKCLFCLVMYIESCLLYTSRCV